MMKCWFFQEVSYRFDCGINEWQRIIVALYEHKNDETFESEKNSLTTIIILDIFFTLWWSINFGSSRVYSNFQNSLIHQFIKNNNKFDHHIYLYIARFFKLVHCLKSMLRMKFVIYMMFIFLLYIYIY